MVTIKVGGIRATIDGYKWTSENVDLVKVLNARLDPLGPSGADPYPDLTALDSRARIKYTAAIDATKLLGGKVIEYDDLPDGPKNLVI